MSSYYRPVVFTFSALNTSAARWNDDVARWTRRLHTLTRWDWFRAGMYCEGWG